MIGEKHFILYVFTNLIINLGLHPDTPTQKTESVSSIGARVGPPGENATSHRTTMKQTHTRRDKGRAVFLAALMVLSVFAMSVSFTGAAVAAADGVTVSTDTVNLLNEDPENVDVEVSHADTDAEVAIAIANEDGEVVHSDNVANDAGATSTTFTEIDLSD